MQLFHGGHGFLDIDDVLLAENSQIIREYLRSLEPVRAVASASNSRRILKRQRSGTHGMSDRALQKHCDAYVKNGVNWWETTVCTEHNMQLWPGLRALTERQSQVLEVKRFSVEHTSRRFATVDRTLPWVQVCEEGVPCLTASTKLYIEHRRRLAVGIEFMRVQGIFYLQTWSVLSTKRLITVH